MKVSCCTLLLFLVSVPSSAMKNRFQDFAEPCEVVWKAAMAVGKTQEYRLISVNTEERLMSLSVGGFWFGERLISLTVAPAPERGCRVTIQSRFSGLLHSDGPDILTRIRVQLIGDELGRDSEAFQRFKRCAESGASSEAKCEDKLRERLAQKTSDNRSDSSNWWNIQKPTPEPQR